MSIGDTIVNDLAALSPSVKVSTEGPNRTYDIVASDIMGAGKGGSCLNQNFNFEEGGIGWTAIQGNPVFTTITDGTVGAGVAQSTGFQTLVLYSKDFIPINPTRTYSVNGFLRRISGTSAGNVCSIGVNFYDDMENLVATNYYAANNVAPSTTWTQYSALFGIGTANPFPANASYMQPVLVLNYGNGALTSPPFNIPSYVSDFAYQAQSIRIDETPLVDGSTITMSNTGVLSGAASTNTNYTLSYVNGLFDTGSIAGWNLYNDGASATPVDGTGGIVSNLTFAANSSSPLVGAFDARLVLSANNDQGEGLSYDFTVDNAAVFQPIYISFYYTTTANYVDGDIDVWIYDKTNNVLIAPSNQAIPEAPTSTYFSGFFIPNSNSTSYRLIFHISTTNATGYTFEIDQVFVGRTNTLIGTAISGWTAYTPTISGGTPNAGAVIEGYWRRVGSDMEIHFHFYQASAGTAGGGLYQFSLPSGYTVDFTKLDAAGGVGFSNYVGICTVYLPSSATYMQGEVVVGVGTSSTSFYFQTMGGTGGAGTSVIDTFQNVGSTWFSFGGAPLAYEAHLKVPITQWSTNINLVNDFTEYAFNTSTTTTQDLTSFGYGSQGALIQAFAPGGTSLVIKRVQFQRLIQATDLIVIEINDGNGWQTLPNNGVGLGPAAVVGSTTTYGGVSYAISGTNTVDVQFWAVANLSSSAWSILSTYRWRVRKTSQGNFAEQTPSLILLPRDNTNRFLIAGSGFGSGFTSAIQATGNAGIPGGTKAILASVIISATGAVASAVDVRLQFSDNNTSTPSLSTSHPIAEVSGSEPIAGAAFSLGIPFEVKIPLNALGQFYVYYTAVTAASGTYSVTAKGYYTGGIQT